MTKEKRAALLGKETSRRNKMALLAQYKLEGERVEWQWAGVPYRSRLQVSIDGYPYLTCSSFDEDVLPLMEDHGP